MISAFEHRSNLELLFSDEDGRRLVEFIGGLDEKSLVIAPEFVKSAICAAVPGGGARWTTGQLPAPDGIPAHIRNIVVINDYAEAETRAASLYAGLNGIEVYGMYRHIIPAINAAKSPFDDDAVNPPSKKYALISLPRSGSTMLCALLTNAGLGWPLEHLRVSAAHAVGEAGLAIDDWLDATEAYGQTNGIYGTKLLPQFLIPASGRNYARLDIILSRLARRDYALFHLRRDLIDCVASAITAVAARRWQVFTDEDQAILERATAQWQPGREEIEVRLTNLLADSIIIEAMLKPHRVTDVDYAALCARPQVVIGQIRQALGPSQVAAAIRTPVPRRIRDTIVAYGAVFKAIGEAVASGGERLASITLRRLMDKTALDVSGVRDVLGVDGERLWQMLRQLHDQARERLVW